MARRNKDWRYLCPEVGCPNTYTRAEYARRHAVNTHQNDCRLIRRVPVYDLVNEVESKLLDDPQIENMCEDSNATEIDPLLVEHVHEGCVVKPPASVSTPKIPRTSGYEPNHPSGVKVAKYSTEHKNALEDQSSSQPSSTLPGMHAGYASDRIPENGYDSSSQLARTVRAQEAVIEEMRIMLDQVAHDNRLLKDAIRAIRRTVSSYAFLSRSQASTTYLDEF